MSNYNEPNKTSGQYHSVKGNAVEAIGNLTGAQSWTQSGKEEHAAGETEYKASQAKGYAEGAVTGDKSQQAQGNVRNEQGQAQQDFNKNAS